MTKFHINPETGKPSECRAKTPESCKYSQQSGEIVEHYDSMEKAQSASSQKLHEKYGATSTLSKKSSGTQPGTMEKYEPVVSYQITAYIKTPYNESTVEYNYDSPEAAKKAIKNDPRLQYFPLAEKVDFSLSKKTETIEYLEPEDTELLQENNIDDNNYGVYHTKFLNGRLFGSGVQGSRSTKEKAIEFYQKFKNIIADSPYPEAKPYDDETQSGTVVKIGRKKVALEELSLED